MRIVEHLITGEPILLAPERAARPDSAQHPTSGNCPFCPGHEDETPPEIERAALGNQWIVRVIPNKFPATAQHEVIIESPDHDATFSQGTAASAVTRIYAARYRAIGSVAGIAYVALFKNQGPAAGATIPHAHSQIIGLPFTPPRIAKESAAFARAEHCPLCAALPAHRRDGLMIEENDSFAWLAPASSQMAGEQWIVPKRHQHEISTITEKENGDFAALLQSAANASRRQALDPSYNWLFMNFPHQSTAHFYVILFPRRTIIAGFELATGTYIEVIEPMTTAKQIRG